MGFQAALRARRPATGRGNPACRCHGVLHRATEAATIASWQFSLVAPPAKAYTVLGPHAIVAGKTIADWTQDWLTLPGCNRRYLMHHSALDDFSASLPGTAHQTTGGAGP
jgi:hypothetical protein